MGRLLYNVTVKIDESIEPEWLHWMQEIHIPEVMATGCFESHKIHRLRYPADDEGVTFAVQYVCRDMPTLEIYHSKYASALQKDHQEKFAGKYAAFRTILEEVRHPSDDD